MIIPQMLSLDDVEEEFPPGGLWFQLELQAILVTNLLSAGNKLQAPHVSGLHVLPSFICEEDWVIARPVMINQTSSVEVNDFIVCFLLARAAGVGVL